MDYPDVISNDSPLWLHLMADDYSGWLEAEPHQVPRVISRDFVSGACDEPREAEACAA